MKKPRVKLSWWDCAGDRLPKGLPGLWLGCSVRNPKHSTLGSPLLPITYSDPKVLSHMAWPRHSRRALHTDKGGFSGGIVIGLNS